MVKKATTYQTIYSEMQPRIKLLHPRCAQLITDCGQRIKRQDLAAVCVHN